MDSDYSIEPVSRIAPAQQVDNFDYIEESIERRSGPPEPPLTLEQLPMPPDFEKLTSKEQWADVRSLFNLVTSQMLQSIIRTLRKDFKQVQQGY